MEERLAIDYGKSRIGLSIGAVIAREYKTIPNNDHAIPEIVRIIAEEHISTIVIGEPIRSHGEAGTLHQEIQDFILVLSEKAPGVTIVTEDEAYTSVQARDDLKELGVKDGDIKSRVDAYAAKLLLDQYNHEHPVI